MMTTHSTSNRSGFTLIEVLIATFILALGSLGLIVLFAGAATQQQRSAQLDQSVFVSQNAEAMMARRFGSIDGPGLALLNPGEWYRLPARTLLGRPGIGALSIDPATSGNFFFRLEEPNDVVLYKRDPTNPNAVVTSATPTPNPPVNLDAGAWSPVYDGSVTTTGHARTAARSMRVEVTLARIDAIPPTPGQIVETLAPIVFEYVDEGTGGAFPPSFPMAWPASAGGFGGNAGDRNNERVVLAPGGAAGVGNDPNTASYIVLERAHDWDPTCRGCKTTELTRIIDLRIDDVFRLNPPPTPPNPPSWWVVEEIRLKGGFEYLTTDVISLDDRVVYANDDDYPHPLPGRPAAAYALLYRTSSDGSASQIAAFTYTISAGRPGEAYLPDEQADQNVASPNLDAPVQRIDAILRFDTTLKQYYIQPEQADDNWIIDPGQILLVAGDTLKPGADFAVRVLSQRNVGGQLRGYLDRVPRAGGQALIDDRQLDQRVVVWAVQPNVKNIDTAGGPAVRWRLTPQEVRIFQL
ncbi:MAG: prepilin-type N-terminal cleavage/methylation domain-containing protein [Phycisphaerales bacterium]|nr:prepilin-type N-terminal cleavage/methylation domain-containing protein [Phycisphaerales bacterium]